MIYKHKVSSWPQTHWESWEELIQSNQTSGSARSLSAPLLDLHSPATLQPSSVCESRSSLFGEKLRMVALQEKDWKLQGQTTHLTLTSVSHSINVLQFLKCLKRFFSVSWHALNRLSVQSSRPARLRWIITTQRLWCFQTFIRWRSNF